MPTRPRRPCTTAYCPNLQPCPTHAKRPWDHGGKSSSARGYGATWRKIRAWILVRDLHLCQACRRQGTITRATTVDHIVPKVAGGTDEDSNLESLCRRHQQEKGSREGRVR